MHQCLSLLDTSQLSYFLIYLLRKFVNMSTFAPMISPSFLRSLEDLQISEFPATEGLDSSVTPWEVGISTESLWPLCLGFCLSLTIVVIDHYFYFSRVWLPTAPVWEESCPPHALVFRTPHNHDSLLCYRTCLQWCWSPWKMTMRWKTIKHKHLSNKGLLNARIGWVKLYPEWEEVIPDCEKSQERRNIRHLSGGSDLVPDVVGGNSAHGRGTGIRSWRSLPTQAFLWVYST